MTQSAMSASGAIAERLRARSCAIATTSLPAGYPPVCGYGAQGLVSRTSRLGSFVGGAAGFAVRQGRVADAGALADLQLRSWRVAFSHLPVGRMVDDISHAEIEQARAHWLEQKQVPDVVWVATAGEHIVGYARTCWWQDTDDLPARTVKLHALYVDPDFMGRGLGSMLLEQAVATAHQAAATVMALWTPTDLERTHRFYERHGWQADPGWTKPWRGTIEVRYRRDF